MCFLVDTDAPDGYAWMICKCITRNGKKRCKEQGNYKFLVKKK